LAIFAYGSLLFRPGFVYLGRERAIATGYARSFTQASPDHRGTPAQPGRVVTLRTRPEAVTAGAVYFVAAPAEQLLRELDWRERAGYERLSLPVTTAAGVVQAVTWVAHPGNDFDAAELPLEQLAEHVRQCTGPSGRNDDYVFALERALAELDAADPFVSALADLLRR
jgi:cation transport regulator ChaC